MPLEFSSLTAAASARCTAGLSVARPLGVLTGSLASNGLEKGLAPVVPSEFSAKRRKRIAPLESRSSRTFHASSTGQALLTSSGPLVPTIVGLALHIATRSFFHNSP